MSKKLCFFLLSTCAAYAALCTDVCAQETRIGPFDIGKTEITADLELDIQFAASLCQPKEVLCILIGTSDQTCAHDDCGSVNRRLARERTLLVQRHFIKDFGISSARLLILSSPGEPSISRHVTVIAVSPGKNILSRPDTPEEAKFRGSTQDEPQDQPLEEEIQPLPVPPIWSVTPLPEVSPSTALPYPPQKDADPSPSDPPLRVNPDQKLAACRLALKDVLDAWSTYIRTH